MRVLTAAAAIMLLAFPALAADPSAPGESQRKQEQAAELAIEATQKLMAALELLIQSLPQYGMPRIDEDGNIVIPRLPKTGDSESGGEGGEEPGPEGDPI